MLFHFTSVRYDNYPTHTDKDYRGRVTKINTHNAAGANFGLASLNITNVTEADQGWYNCKVLFIDRCVKGQGGANRPKKGLKIENNGKVADLT